MSAARGTSRRSVLLRSAAALVSIAAAGCTSTDGPPPPPPPPDPDDALRDAATARERALLQAYDAVVLADPDLAARLAPLRTQHVEHLAALTGPGPTPASTTPTPPAGAAPVPTAPAPTAPAPTAPAPAPQPPAAALASLTDAERGAAARHAEDAVAAGDRVLASLLAALSASEASHPVALA